MTDEEAWVYVRGLPQEAIYAYSRDIEENMKKRLCKMTVKDVAVMAATTEEVNYWSVAQFDDLIKQRL